MTDKRLVRSFIAIPLSAQLRAATAVIQKRMRQVLPNVRWAKPESLHLTLHFFGDIDEESLEKAGSIMVSIESLFSPFHMRLVGVGAFPSTKQANIIWLGVKSAKLATLHAELTGRLREEGLLCKKQQYSPHITLGRCRDNTHKSGHILSQEKDTVAGEMMIDSLVLFESELLPTGAVHRPRFTAHLTAD